MTNEETNKKALEIAGKYSHVSEEPLHIEKTFNECYASAMQMAKWKDEETRNMVINVWLSSIMCQDHTLSNKDNQYIDLDKLKNILEDFFHIKLEEE